MNAPRMTCFVAALAFTTWSCSGHVVGAADERITEALTKEARKLGADAIFDVSVTSYTGTCETVEDEEEEDCAWAYGMATAILFKGANDPGL